MNTAPLVSVVTPFYNTETYLAECMESVLAQTYQNWEYILVNNCSTDRSSDIAQQYVEKDQRFRLIHNEKLLTQVENYNYALRQVSSRSKYCKIVQADDWIFPNCLEEMVRAAESALNVALVGSYSLYEPLPGYSGDLPYIGHNVLPYTCRIVPGRQLLRCYLSESFNVFGSPTCVMYRTSDVLRRHDFFDLESPDEDIEACFDVLQNGDFAFVHQILTFNRRQEGSFWWKISGFNIDRLNKMILTYRYGMKLFESAECKELLHRIEAKYYSALGQALLEGRPAAFWEFQAQGLAVIGQRIQRLRLAWYLLRALLDFLGNPKATLGRLLRA
jgi:glycosyltransferase involved in cell wall biosynthesis